MTSIVNLDLNACSDTETMSYIVDFCPINQPMFYILEFCPINQLDVAFIDAYHRGPDERVN